MFENIAVETKTHIWRKIAINLYFLMRKLVFYAMSSIIYQKKSDIKKSFVIFPVSVSIWYDSNVLGSIC